MMSWPIGGILGGVSVVVIASLGPLLSISAKLSQGGVCKGKVVKLCFASFGLKAGDGG